MTVIDHDGYRANVGIVICNTKGQVLWAKRIYQNSWQFPQGGFDSTDFSAVTAMYRELYEELGLEKKDVILLAESSKWYKYKLPKRMIRWQDNVVCLGQKQKWFLLLINDDNQKKIEFNLQGHPEFDAYRFVSYWYPVRQVVSFKRDVYRSVLTEFAPYALFNRE